MRNAMRYAARLDKIVLDNKNSIPDSRSIATV